MMESVDLMFDDSDDEYLTFFFCSKFPSSVRRIWVLARTPHCNPRIWVVLVLRRQDYPFLSCVVTLLSLTKSHVTNRSLSEDGIAIHCHATQLLIGPSDFAHISLTQGRIERDRLDHIESVWTLGPHEDDSQYLWLPTTYVGTGTFSGKTRFLPIHSCVAPFVTVLSRPPKSRITCRAQEQRPCRLHALPDVTARDATSTSKKEIRTSTFSSALKRLSSRHDYEQFSQFSWILEDIRSDQRWYASVLAIFTLCREDGFHEVDFWSRVVRHTASFWGFCSCAVNFFEYVRLFFILKSKASTYWFQWCLIWTIAIFRYAEYVNWFIQLLNVTPHLSDCSICLD